MREMGDYETPVRTPAGYHCPLCPDHSDDLYFDWSLFDGPICEGCTLELSHFIFDQERPDDFLIDRVEQATGRSWRECRAAFLQDMLTYYERVQLEQPREWVSAFLQELCEALGERAH
jgi:hypothetical protein